MDSEKKKIPELEIEKVCISLDDLSPRSEEFREQQSGNYCIWIAPNPQAHVANTPYETVSAKSTKNPLLLNKNTYVELMKTQEKDLQGLYLANEMLETKLQECEKEMSLMKNFNSLIKEKEKTIKTLETTLELAEEEMKMLKNAQETPKIPEKTTVSSYEYFNITRPKRVWTCSEQISQLNNIKDKVIQALHHKISLNF